MGEYAGSAGSAAAAAATTDPAGLVDAPGDTPAPLSGDGVDATALSGEEGSAGAWSVRGWKRSPRWDTTPVKLLPAAVSFRTLAALGREEPSSEERGGESWSGGGEREAGRALSREKRVALGWRQPRQGALGAGRAALHWQGVSAVGRRLRCVGDEGGVAAAIWYLDLPAIAAVLWCVGGKCFHARVADVE